MEQVASTTALGKLLDWCSRQKATDLHAQADRRYSIRVDGKLQRIPQEQFPPPSNDEIVHILREAFSASIYDRIERQRETDLSFLCAAMRYRANFSKQQGKQSFSFRVVPQSMMQFQELALPSTILDLIREPRGLIIISGAAGQGKSTTARALLQKLNETMALRVITIEDPIEYLFQEQKCQYEQREVGVDTESFADGIRNAVRQDPDVIFVGEMRDQASILAGLQAAETGHLVVTTLHADSAPQVLERLRQFYPAPEQANISALLARCLNAIVCQRLIPSTFGKRIPCLEVMKRNVGVQDCIARHDMPMLAGHIEAAVNEGMHSFDQYLMRLLQDKYVTEDTARRYANNWNMFEMEMHGFLPSTSGILKPE
jgi:twitching motility protein PilT